MGPNVLLHSFGTPEATRRSFTISAPLGVALLIVGHGSEWSHKGNGPIAPVLGRQRDGDA